MTELVAGQVYTARLVRSGVSQRGAWEIVTVSDKKQKNDVAIFPRNIPTGVVEGGQFKLEQILSIKNGMRKDKTDHWQHNVSCEAVITPIASEFDTGLAGGGDVDWSDLTDTGDPWADISELPV